MSIRGIKRVLLMAVLATSICRTQALKLDSSAQANQRRHDESNLSYASSLKLLKQSPNIGFGNMVSDYGFLQFLQYFGDDEIREVTGYKLSPLFFETILRHDPNYRDYYLFLSGSSTIRAGLPGKTISLMNENLKRLSPAAPHDGYYIWRYKAVDELLFLGDGESARKSFEMAAKWAHESSDEEASTVGKLSEQTAQFLADNPASKLAQINAWGSILTTALDNETRKRAITRIQALGGDVVIGGDGQLQIKFAQVEETPGGGKPDS